MFIWDYQIPANWKPQTDAEWQWFLVRKLQYRDFQGLPEEKIRKYLPAIKHQLEPAVVRMFEAYFIKTLNKE